MIIDFHAHTWAFDDAEEAMARECRRHGVDKVCISAVESPIPDLDEVKRVNDRCFQAARDYPDLYLPFVYVNPLHGKAAMTEMERRRDEGAVGLKLWISCYCTHPSVFPVVERAIEWNCGTRSSGSMRARATRCMWRSCRGSTRR